MHKNEIKKRAFAMPFCNPTYPPGPYRFINREYLIITYETDLEKLKAIVPEPLEVIEPLVKYEFIRMPDSSGFGDYTESGQVIPVHYKKKPGNYVHSMYLDCEPPIAAGREIWGFPKTLASPSLRIDSDVLVGELHYQGIRVALGTMGYKYKEANIKAVEKNFSETPNYLLKVIPHVDGTARICELVTHHLTEVKVKGAWEGPAALELVPHAMAPVADLPIRRVVSAIHILSDLTLPYGRVIHDYLRG
jgi:acetoacetate decarboxylase